MSECGFYVHVPFCETKCGYCDFYSVPLMDRPTSPLVARLVTDIEGRAGEYSGDIVTMFIGGGTPTVLPISDFRALFSALGDVAGTHKPREFSVEANPATLDEVKMEILASAGVDRISMGGQSWHPSELETLERLHSPSDIAPGVALARRFGIGRINLDLIFGIPGQTLETWAESLRKTIDLGVDHIACYGLTYEAGTRLTSQLRAGVLTPCDENLEADMFELAVEMLRGDGYAQYEISNFARPGQACLHNLIYWRNDMYIGAGPSAAGYVDGVRYKNVSDVGRYVQMIDSVGHAVLQKERVTGAALAGETLMMQLRLNEGIALGLFASRTGIDLQQVCGSRLEMLRGRGLVDVLEDVVRLTDAGRLVADSIISDLYADVHAAEALSDRS